MRREPIAIVGMGCRFPGSADLPSFWRTLRDGRVVAGPVGRDRWNHDLFYSPSGAKEHNKTYAQKLALIDDVRAFAPEFFGISPRRARVMDPQQRLFLDVVRSALEDAGHPHRPVNRRRTGVFVGATVSDYMDILGARIKATQLAGGEFGPVTMDATSTAALTGDLTQLQAYSLVGTLMNMNAANVNQVFDFGGPAFTMDAACSSALVALHEAAMHLDGGGCDAAVVGGVYLILAPDNMLAFARIGALSPSDACRPFDRRADGFVIGEGVGAIVLKRLSDALASGDRIYALIRGVGMNNDGRAEGPMTPRKEGQIDALDRAYADAGVDPRTVEAIEAHGTATPVGDATEIAAMGEFRGRPGERPCMLTSAKSNIGHSMSAAGIVGLIRATMSVAKRTVTPQAGYAEPRDDLQLAERGFVVPPALADWTAPAGHPRRAGVNSFGFGGTNVHVVLEEAPAPSERPPARVSVPVGTAPSPELIVLSAPTPALLARHAADLAAAIADAPEATVADVAAALAVRRADVARAAFLAEDRAELLAGLTALARPDEVAEGAPEVLVSEASTEPPEPPKVAFMFPGQGAQAPDLCADLYRRVPAFRRALEELTAGLDADGSPLLEALYPTEDLRAQAMQTLTRTEVCQPVMAAVGLALARTARALGLEPAVLLGHSLGELAAAGAAGLVPDAEVVRLVADRGRFIAELPLSDRGGMVAVAADRGRTAALVDGIAGVVVANANHPGQTVVSGTSAGIDQAVARFAAAAVKATRLRVSHAFHSPLMAGLRPHFEARLATLNLHAAEGTLVSAIRPGRYPTEASSVRALWAEHATAPVDFVGALHAAASAGARVFVQMGGGQALAAMARNTLGAPGAAITAFTLAGEEPDGGRTFLTALARLWTAGAALTFAVLHAGRAAGAVFLPPAPLDTRPFWPIRREDVKPGVSSHINPPKLAAAMPVPPRADQNAASPPAPEATAQAGHASAPTSPGDAAALAALFQQQMAVLDAHVAIIRQQNELLARGGSSAMPVLEPRPSTMVGVVPAPVTLATAPSVVSRGRETEPVAEAHHGRNGKHTNGHDGGTSNGNGAYRNGHGQNGKSHGAVNGTNGKHDHHEPTAQPANAGIDLASAQAKVIASVARISASPLERLKPTTKLGSDLGFDSLMVVELASQLAEELPGLGMLPKTLFARDLSIQDVARHVVSALGPDAQATETLAVAPVVRFTRHRVALRPAPLPVAPARGFAGPVLLLGGGAGLGDTVAGALREAGFAVNVEPTGRDAGALAELSAAAAVVDLRPLAFAETGDAPAGVASSLVREAVATARSLDGHRPAAWLVVHRGEAGFGLPGFAKALAKEWDGTTVRAIELEGAFEASSLAALVVGELASGDGSAEVRWSDNTRLAAGFEPAALPAGPGIARGAVALVTGGVGGIGRRVAKALAKQGVHVAVLGRRAPDERTAALMAELHASGARAAYLPCDVRDEASVRAAVAEVARTLGPVSYVVHAAGVLADAPVARKSDDDVAAVFETKLAGAVALWRALEGSEGQPLRAFVGTGSWAGRFGNAHQTDYAAGNGALARWAAAAEGTRPGVRVAVLDLPPWRGVGMAEALPEAIRRELERRVPFLPEEEGVAAILDELGAPAGAAGGELLIGPEALDVPAAERRWPSVVSPASMPYLLDHRIEGRPVLPLAATAAHMAEAVRSLGAAGADAPVVLRELTVIEGVVLESDERAGHVVLVASGDGRSAELSLLRLDGRARPALRARASVGVESTPAVSLASVPASSLALRPPPMPLELFYEAHTFHGPSLRAIRSVESVGAAHVVGTVAALPLEGGTPLVAALDGALQLLAYWAVTRHGRGGLPVEVAELHLRREPIAGETLRCVGALRTTDDDALIGDVDLLDDAGSLVLALRGLRAELRSLRPKAARGPAEPVIAVPNEHVLVSEFPEVKELEQRLTMAQVMGISNPYFRSFEGTNAATAVMGGRKLINFSSYNYLGLSGHPEVNRAVVAAVERYGTSVSASRVASGERPLHGQLERAIADFVGTEDAFVMVGGHATNVSVIGHLLGPEDLVVHDSLAHDSILGGVRLSGAKRRPFAHNDPAALERILSETRAGVRRVLIAIEGVYSMDGDIAPLARFVDIKKRYGAMLFVDEAHSLGVLGRTGRGIGEHAGIDPNDVDLWMGTMSKSLASCGGYIAGSRALVNYLRYTVPGFVYSVGISPANAAAALEALRLLQAHPELPRDLQRKSRFFLELCRARGLDTGMSEGSAVIPCIVGNSYACLQLSQALEARGINVQPILYPAVEENMARLRFFVSVTHTEEQLERAANILAEEFERVVRPIRPATDGGHTRGSAETSQSPEART